MRNTLINSLVQKAIVVWSDIESEREQRIDVLNTVRHSLAQIATPNEENNVKIDLVRRICERLRRMYPSYTNSIDEIVMPFEQHLTKDELAILPFKQIDELTYRIFMKQNMMGFVG